MLDDHIHGDGDSDAVLLSTQDESHMDIPEAMVMGDRERAELQEKKQQIREQAFSYKADRQWAEAVDTFLLLLDIDPDDENTLIEIGDCVDKMNDFDLLYEIASQFSEQHPDSAHALALQARALQKMGRLSEATIANDQALLLDKKLGLAWINRCGLQLIQGKSPEALRSSQRAIELAPTDPRAWSNRGVALANFNRLEEALEALDTSLKLDNTQLFAIQMKCEIFSRIGRMRDVLLLAEQGLNVESSNLNLLTKAIQALRSLERYTELCEFSQKFIEISEDSSFAWEHYMRGLRGLGKFEEANEALDRLLELETADVRFWTLKADTLYRIERYRDAVHAAEQARSISPEYPPAQRIYEKSLRLMYQRKDKRKQHKS
jgi:tetratricopeptide (TPR) repeat protein